MKSCKEISFLMSQQLDRPLTLAEKVSIQLHRLGCKGCSRYESNLRLIRKACKEAKRLSKD